MAQGVALVVTAGVAWGGTWWIRHYALRRALIDVPNHRSSHVHPTPRGGGVAIVAAWVGCLIWVGWQSGPVVPWAAVTAACVVAVVGFMDDHQSLSAWLRLGAHLSAGVVMVWSIGGWPLGAGWEWAGAVVGIWVVAWWINLTNFMDGIDGLAALHVITVCLGGVACLVAGGVGVADVRLIPGLALAAASLGFLVWNWPPARIFMGDAGSGFLGAAVAACLLQAGQVTPALGWAWALLSGTFVVDATVTLAVRVVRREPLFEAHRTHAYQRLTRHLRGHRPVTVLWSVVTVVWLWPWALGVARGAVDGEVAVAAAWGPLVLVVLAVARWAPGDERGSRDVA